MPKRLSPTTRVALACLCAASSCKQLPREPDPAPSPAPVAADAVSAAMARGDLDAARSALDALLVERELAAARTALAAGVPEDALLAIDRALEIAPKNEPALELKAQGSTALADLMIQRGMGAPFIEGSLVDALRATLALPPTIERRLQASQLAGRLGRTDEALGLARRAVEALPNSDAPADLELATAAHRAWSQAALRATIAQLSFERGLTESDPGTDAEALGAEAEDAIMSTLGFAPDDLSLWTDLANLYLWQGDAASALELDARALGRFPGNRELLDALVSAAEQLGPGTALDALEALGDEPVVYAFYQGRQQLLDALPLISSSPPAAFAATTEALGRLARVDAAATALFEEARGWRIIGRAVAGWALYDQDDLAGASTWFLSMNELAPDGIGWQLEGRVRSGIDGLFYIGDEYRKRGEWELAAQTFQALEQVQPDFANWANDAGYFAREAAVALESDAQDLFRAAAGELSDERRLEELRQLAQVPAQEQGSDQERQRFGELAKQRLARALELAHASYRSYQHGVELTPDDARLVNDTALMQVYHLHEDLDTAESMLHRAIALATAQLAQDDSALDDEARTALLEALGDAYQNLGVLTMAFKGDPAAAIPILEQAVATGPGPRPNITEGLLPWCRGELEAPIEAVFPDLHWGQAPGSN